jgi:hypothetical protein
LNNPKEKGKSSLFTWATLQPMAIVAHWPNLAAFGFVFCLNGGVMSWKSSQQDIVVDSMMENEYIAASKAAKEAFWIRFFVSELGVVPSASSPVDLYYDNSGAIA